MVLAAYGQNPPDVGQLHKVFKTRLSDQFIQDWQSVISSSMSTRLDLTVAFQLPKYINAIRNPDIRLIYKEHILTYYQLVGPVKSNPESVQCVTRNQKLYRILFCTICISW